MIYLIKLNNNIIKIKDLLFLQLIIFYLLLWTLNPSSQAGQKKWEKSCQFPFYYFVFFLNTGYRKLSFLVGKFEKIVFFFFKFRVRIGIGICSLIFHVYKEEEYN